METFILSLFFCSLMLVGLINNQLSPSVQIFARKFPDKNIRPPLYLTTSISAIVFFLSCIIIEKINFQSHLPSHNSHQLLIARHDTVDMLIRD